eukprot:Selendium_serpulae@DN5667_c0_g1_i13.p1
MKGNKSYIKLLMDAGYSTSLRDCWDLTPSVLACLYGHKEAAGLLDKGVPPTTNDETSEQNAEKEEDTVATGVRDETVIQALLVTLDENKHPANTQIPRAVKRIGPDKCLQILTELTKIVKTEGLPLTKDGSRRKSMGGAFLTMLKSQVAREDWDYIRAEVKEYEKALKKRLLARPRKPVQSPRRGRVEFRQPDYSGFQDGYYLTQYPIQVVDPHAQWYPGPLSWPPVPPMHHQHPPYN